MWAARLALLPAVLLLALALSPAASLAVEATEPFDSAALEAFFDALDDEYAKLTAVSYSFEQTQRIPELTGEITLTGSVIHQRPAELRLEARGHENFDLLSDGATIWLVDRDFDDVESFPLPDFGAAPRSRLLPPLLLDDPAQWRQELEVVVFEQNGSRRRLVFEPVPGAASRFESLTLVFKGHRLKESIAHYGEGDEATTSYSDWQRLGSVSHAIFRYQGGN